MTVYGYILAANYVESKNCVCSETGQIACKQTFVFHSFRIYSGSLSVSFPKFGFLLFETANLLIFLKLPWTGKS